MRGHLVQHPHVTDGQTEVQKGEVTEPKSHSELLTKLKSETELFFFYTWFCISCCFPDTNCFLFPCSSAFPPSCSAMAILVVGMWVCLLFLFGVHIFFSPPPPLAGLLWCSLILLLLIPLPFPSVNGYPSQTRKHRLE